MIKKLLFTLFLVLSQTVVLSQTNTYIGPNTGGWNTASNWDLGSVPTGSHDVVIPSGKIVTISADAVAKSVTISGTLSMTFKADFTINTQLVVVTSSGIISFDNSVLRLPSTVSLYLQNGSNSLGGDCNNNDEIFVGTQQYGVCTGGGATYLFQAIEDAGGVNVVTAGTIGTAQTICSGSTPATLTSTTNATGSGTITYEWQTNATGSYVTISSATAATYSPTALTTTTGYQRRTVSIVEGKTFYSAYTTPVTITVTANNTVGAASSTPTLCINTALTNITHTTTGATGILNNNVTGANGLPSGIKAVWASNTITISGTPTASGSFNYIIPLTGGCGTVNAIGTITVNDLKTAGAASSTPTLCINTALTNITHATTGATGIGASTGLPAGVTAAWASNTITISGTPTASGTFSYVIPLTGGCGSVNATGTIIVNPIPTAPIFVSGDIAQPNCSTVTGSVFLSGLPASGTWTLIRSGTSVATTTGTGASTTISGLSVGTYYYTVSNGTCTSVASSGVVINAQPATPVQPILSTPIQPTCTTSTGSFTITNYNATYTYTASPSAGVTISGDTVTAPTGSYTLTATLGTCTSVVSSGVAINNQGTNTWNGSAWSTGLAPTSSEKIVFAGNYSSSSDLVACSCQVNSGTVVINSGNTLTLTNALVVSGGSMTFENNASLVQINDNAINVGDITYKRSNATTRETDYTYWSSPVAGQTLKNLSPKTPSNFFYSFNAAADDWSQENSANVMSIGNGYIIRGPHYTSTPPPGFYEAPFQGIPNNGKITIPIGGLDSSNLIGNPYPSALDADKFLTDNSAVLDGTLYFWTHNTAIDLAGNISNPGSGAYAYSSDDYASYNLTGGVGTDGVTYLQGGTVAPNGGQKPSGKIGSGQGFFATGKASGTATFNNSMRVGVGSITGDNSQFFKIANSKTTSLIEKHRVWLNLTNSEGAFKQMLVGYVSNATNEYDNAFDGESFDGNQFVDFYSVNEDKNLTIQGRALPFDENDEVLLGFSSTIEGIFSIGIDEVDGLFTSQDVFIQDKNTNSIKNLKDGPYTFTTESGTFNDRFVLRYTNTNKTLDTGGFETLENTVLVSNKNKLIKINSSVETINKVQVYDLSGKSVYQKLNVGTNELTISNLVMNHQVLLVKILLQNGKTVTNKIVY